MAVTWFSMLSVAFGVSLGILASSIKYWNGDTVTQPTAFSDQSVKTIETTSRHLEWAPLHPYGWTDLNDTDDDGTLPIHEARLIGIEAAGADPAAIHARIVGGFPLPKYLPTKTLEEATPEWLHAEAQIVKPLEGWTDERVPWSIFHAPDPIKAKKNTGYIMVAVTSCCNSWNMTHALLQSLLDMVDPIHVVLFDDNSKDGAQEYAAAMGIPVFTTGRMTGLTASMNRAWKYFTSYPQLQAMFLINNDIELSPGSFKKLHRCLESAPYDGVVSAMSNNAGVPGISTQSCDSPTSRRKYYNDTKAPKEIRYDLPAKLKEYNDWLELATQHTASFGKVFPITNVMGFVMGFNKSTPIRSYARNILMNAGVNAHQEKFLFEVWRLQAYVCTDVFVYHDKAATMNPKHGLLHQLTHPNQS